MYACVRNACAQQRHSDALDDVLRLTPAAALVTLRLSGVETDRTWQQSLSGLCLSYGLTLGSVYGLKHAVHETRPDASDRHSFPSGHAAVAFAGAHALHKEYGHVSPWVSVAGYGVATFVAIDRVAKDRHHWYDVCTGAALGVAATEAGYWLSGKLFPGERVAVSFAGSQVGFMMVF